MTTFLINIIARSNLAEVLAKDNVALEANSAAMKANSASLVANSMASARAARQKRGLVQQTFNATGAFNKATQSVKNFVISLFGLDEATSRVGYNIMGFSFRIGQWFVPAMLLMATALLPVIAGLLAIGSAAAVAGLGILGVLGLGAALMQHRMNKEGAEGGYGGARRPYSGGGGGSTKSVWTVLLEPIWQVLDSPKYKSAVDNAVLFVKATFGGLAEALGSFLSNVDPGMVGWLEELFLDWLPKAGASVAKWGSRLVQMIGGGSISRINDFFKYLADGIMSTAEWLNDGGWEQLDEFAAIGKDVIGTLMVMGKSAFPILLQVLRKIWPFPLKPVFLAIATFLSDVGHNENVMKVIGGIAQVIVLFVIIKIALISVVSLFLTAVGKLLIIGAAIYVAAAGISYFVNNAIALFLSFFQFIRDSLVLAFLQALATILQKVGINVETPEYDLDPKKVLSGEYGGGKFYRDAQVDKARMQGINAVTMGALNGIDVFFHPDGAVIDDAVKQSVYEKTGSFESANNKLTARSQRTVSL
jgi:hypothetical protein